MKSNKFQIIVLSIFIFAAVVAVLIFSGIVPGFGGILGDEASDVVLWGTVPENVINPHITQVNRSFGDSVNIEYIEKSPATYENDIIQALAAGEGPDIFMFPQNFIVPHQDKVFLLPYEFVTEREFKDQFIQEGELFLTSNGAIAFPFFIDPIVMYWNRDIFSSEGVARPPRYWDEILTLAPDLTITDLQKNISRSTVSFGEFLNVDNAKDILAMLIIQTGDRIVYRRDDDRLFLAFGKSTQDVLEPAESALRFFMEFSNSAKPVYSWNKSLPSSRSMFLSGDLAIYFGYASELDDIVEKNPHLNFDIAPVPQLRGNNTRITYGDITGVAVSRNTRSPQASLQAVALLTQQDFIEKISPAVGLPPVRRDILAQPPTDAYQSVFYDSALISRGWLDVNPDATYNIFREMVDGVSSGRFRASEAVGRAAGQMGRLITN